MAAIRYTIPITKQASFFIQEEKLAQFYPFLHRHRQVQVCWVKKGEGTLIVEGKIFAFRTGDTFAIASNMAHLFMNEQMTGVETLSLFMDVDPAYSTIMGLPELRQTSRNLLRIPPCSRLPNTINHLLGKLLTAEGVPSLSILLEIFSFLTSTVSTGSKFLRSSSEKSGARMQVIMKYTIDNLDQDLKIAAVAKQISYTPEAFCRFFKKRTGRTYINYLSEIRITEACNRILHQEIRDIQSVAYSCGFNNVSHFNRVFKKIKGCSPMQFKKSSQK